MTSGASVLEKEYGKDCCHASTGMSWSRQVEHLVYVLEYGPENFPRTDLEHSCTSRTLMKLSAAELDSFLQEAVLRSNL